MTATIEKALGMASRGPDAVQQPVLEQLERYAFLEWSRGRFESDNRRRWAREQFNARTLSINDRLRKEVVRSGQRWTLGLVRLRLLAIKGLEGGCEYCGDLLALDAFEMAFDTPPVGRLDLNGFSCEAVVACCGGCERGKQNLSGIEWLNVLAAVRAADSEAGAALLRYLAERQAGRASRKGTSGGVGRRG